MEETSACTSEHEEKRRLPRSQKKQLKRLQAINQRKQNRKNKKEKKKMEKKHKEAVEESGEGCETEINPSEEGTHETHETKKQQLKNIRLRCQEGLNSGQKICVDCSFQGNMTSVECSKLAQQIGRAYGVNRKSECPAAIYLTNLQEGSLLYEECVRVNCGFTKYHLHRYAESLLEIFKQEELVYLSPNADEPLDDVEANRVYVIGGLVDSTIQSNISKNRASKDSIVVKRLPIMEHMNKGKAHLNQVLTVNQVFEILLLRSQGQQWKDILAKCVPTRKGFTVKESI